MSLTVGSLFAGVGGFDLAAESAGMRVLWQSEVDPHASKVLAEHWPEVPNHGDIHNIRLENTGRRRPDDGTGTPSGTTGGGEPSVGEPVLRDTDHGGNDDRTNAAAVDVLVGGFPCQDYSMAGIRNGLAGDRGALWWEFHRLIAEGRPRWVVGENVPGLLSSADGRDFATIIRSLVELGYGVVWRVLDAQWFGVPQRRRRVFIVGHSGGIPRPEVLALAESMSGHPEPSRETRQEDAGTVADGARGSGLLADTGIVRSLKERYGSSGSDLDDAEGGHLVPTVGPLTAGMHRGPRGTEAVDSGHILPMTVHATQNPITAVDRAHALGVSSRQAVLMRMREEKPGGGKGPLVSEDRSLTLAANTNDQTLFNGMQVRRLTPLETERLQGFPDNWTASQSAMQRYRQMGNAVAVPVVEWIMHRIVTIDKGDA